MSIRTLNPEFLKLTMLALLVVACLANFKTGRAASLTGQVFAVESGNLISLSTASGKQRRVQLIGISPPAPGTPMVRISRRHLHMLVAGKFISVVYQTLTPNGDILGQVLHGGSDISLRMLEAGLVRVDPDERLAPEILRQYQHAQRQAQIRQTGLWRNRQH